MKTALKITIPSIVIGLKKLLFSTNSLGKSLPDSLLSHSLLLDSLYAGVRFVYHENDCRPNWTPLSPITVSNYHSLCVIQFCQATMAKVKEYLRTRVRMYNHKAD